MKFGARLRTVYLGVAFLAVIIGLWPLTTINPIADDLHLLAQGSGLMRQEGFMSVMQRWASFDLWSAHVTPLGGVFTTAHIWLVNQLSMRTPVSIEDAWGLARICWVIGAVVSVIWCVRQILRSLYPDSLAWLGTAFVLMATIQVHGFWSNDPVVAFPVASWAFCIIGFVFLGLTWRCIWFEERPTARSFLLLMGVSAVGVLTYELFLAFLVAASLMYLAALISGHRSMHRVVVPFFLSSALPAFLLVFTQLIRMSRGSTYSGTTISVNDSSVVSVVAMAMLSALPGATSRLSRDLLPRMSPSSFFVGTTVASMAVLLLVAVRVLGRSMPSPDRHTIRKVVHFTIAMTGLWATSTVIIALTPKYQQEMGGVLGKVYVNYAPAWLAIGALISVVLVYLKSRRRIRALVIILSLLFASGIGHAWLNLAQIDVLAGDSSWSTSLLRQLESRPEENESRCRQVELLFGLPWPEYYQTEILDGLQKTYSGSNGIPYCNFASPDGRTRVLVRPLVGTFPVEFLPDGRRIMWSNQSEVGLQLVNSSNETMRGSIEMNVSLSPCASRMGLAFTVGGESTDYLLTTESPTATIRFAVDIEAGQTSSVSITQSGSGCTVSTDPRTFWSMIELPMLVRS